MPGIPSNPFVALLDAIPWTAVDELRGQNRPSVPGAPHVTHEGFVTIGAARLRVLRLSDGQRIIDPGELQAFPTRGRAAET